MTALIRQFLVTVVLWAEGNVDRRSKNSQLPWQLELQGGVEQKAEGRLQKGKNKETQIELFSKLVVSPCASPMAALAGFCFFFTLSPVMGHHFPPP